MLQMMFSLCFVIVLKIHFCMRLFPSLMLFRKYFLWHVCLFIIFFNITVHFLISSKEFLITPIWKTENSQNLLNNISFFQIISVNSTVTWHAQFKMDLFYNQPFKP